MKTKITAYDHNGNVLPDFPIECERFGTQINSPVCYVYKSEIAGGGFDMAISAPAIIIEYAIPETTFPRTLSTKTQQQQYHIRLYKNAERNLVSEWIGTDLICHHHWTAFTVEDIQYWITGTVVVIKIRSSSP